ncbi:PIN domain-containing protein [Candidatus Woesearchaeota archaeon]|nr:PIN domain-containing protein [Candidatus Woesearchaeota archaeon]
MKVYVDTNVILDYLEQRKNVVGENLSTAAFMFFAKALRCDYYIIISDHTLIELLNYLEEQLAESFFKMMDRKTIKIHATPKDRELAKTIPTHFADALHIVLASRAGASMIVTRNVKDFEGLFKTVRPEDV